LHILIRSNRLDTIDVKDLECFCKSEWRNLIFKLCKDIELEIKKRKTKGERFSDIFAQISKIKDDLIIVDDIELEKLESMYYSDVRPLVGDTKERIEIEKYNNNRYYKGIIIGFVLGLIASFLASLILNYI